MCHKGRKNIQFFFYIRLFYLKVLGRHLDHGPVVVMTMKLNGHRVQRHPMMMFKVQGVAEELVTTIITGRHLSSHRQLCGAYVVMATLW